MYPVKNLKNVYIVKTAYLYIFSNRLDLASVGEDGVKAKYFPIVNNAFITWRSAMKNVFTCGKHVLGSSGLIKSY